MNTSKQQSAGGIAMSESREHHVELHFVRGYEFVATFKDNEGMQAMVFDEPPPLGEGSGPNAAAVLAAAVGNCLAASFAFCLRKVRLEPVDLTASVVAHVDRNPQGRFRVTSIDVELNPELLEGDQARQERCENLFEDFCVVTESVRRGIPVNVKIVDPVGERAA
jgi:organic hydroperoxide reductase OsmC/OhrA